jgi:hypothetical protein
MHTQGQDWRRPRVADRYFTGTQKGSWMRDDQRRSNVQRSSVSELRVFPEGGADRLIVWLEHSRGLDGKSSAWRRKGG